MKKSQVRFATLAVVGALLVSACANTAETSRSAGGQDDDTSITLATAPDVDEGLQAGQDYQDALAARELERQKLQGLAKVNKKQLLRDESADPSIRKLLQTGSCTACDFKDLDITGITFGKVDVSGSNFSGATIYNTTFAEGSNFSNTVFGVSSDRPAQLAGVVATKANWAGAKFTQTQMYDSDISGAELSGVTFSKVIIDPTLVKNQIEWAKNKLTVEDSVIAYPGFVQNADADSDVKGTWGNQNYANTSFLVEPQNRDYLRETKAPNMSITKSRFLGARPDFMQVKFTGTTSLAGSDFSGLSMEQVDLSQADLQETNFRNSSMYEAVMSGVTAHRADFTRARLGDAVLTQAQLGRGVSGNEGSADLTSVDARGADFSGSDLRGTSLRGAYIFSTGKTPKFANAEMGDARLDDALIANGDFSYAKLDRSSFRGTQCINCKFTNATVTSAEFARSYLFGSDFESAVLDKSEFPDAASQSAGGTWKFNTGSGSAPAPVTYAASKGLGAKSFTTVADCPDRSRPSSTTGCAGKELPKSAPPMPPPCIGAGNYLCQTYVSTILGQTGSEAGGTSATTLAEPARVVAYQRGDTGTKIVLVSDTGRNVVRKIDLAQGGATSIVAGVEDKSGFEGDRGPANKALLNAPTGLAVDPAGRVYIADTGNNRIRRIETDGTIVTLAGTGAAGSSGNNIAAIKAQLNRPMGLAVDCDTQRCSVYVADTGNQKIRRITSKDGAPGVISNFAGVGKRTSTPAEISAAGAKCPNTKNVAGIVCLGNNGTALKASFNSPRAIALDNYGNVLIADTGNNQIRSIGPTGTVTKYVIGDADGDDYNLDEPTDLMIDLADNVVISEAGKNRITRWNTFGIADPGIVANKSGARGFSGDGADSLTATFNAPEGVAVTPWETIVVADTGNNRVRELGIR
ncbi:MAG: pentapeptide repeat-containing protein [Candidatus Nanopelagicales bacterium]